MVKAGIGIPHKVDWATTRLHPGWAFSMAFLKKSSNKSDSSLGSFWNALVMSAKKTLRMAYDERNGHGTQGMTILTI